MRAFGGSACPTSSERSAAALADGLRWHPENNQRGRVGRYLAQPRRLLRRLAAISLSGTFAGGATADSKCQPSSGSVASGGSWSYSESKCLIWLPGADST